MMNCISLDNGITMKLSEDDCDRGAVMVATTVAHWLKKQQS